MTCESAEKTEHGSVLGALTNYAMSRVSTRPSLPGYSALVVPVERLRQEISVTSEEIRQLFRSQQTFSVSDFTIRYEVGRDRIHFNRIVEVQASSPVPGAAMSFPVDPIPATAKADPSMTSEQLRAMAKTEWATDENLHREFGSESVYLAFRVADIQGRARISGRTREGGKK